MFHYATEEVGLIGRTPFRGDLMPEPPDFGSQRLTNEEVEQALRAVPPKHDLLVRVAILTGLRFGELRGLLWDAVVFGERPHIIVRRSHDGPTKTKKVRLVPLTKEAEALFRLAPRSSVYVFPGRDGGMMARNACGLNRIIKRAVPRFTMRRLRHTFGSRTAEAGLSSDLLRIAMGHSTVKMTEHYARASDAVVWEKMRALENRLPETGDTPGDIAPASLSREVGKP